MIVPCGTEPEAIDRAVPVTSGTPATWSCARSSAH